jgi:predicted transposase/invertase (TIGR01784 family)
MLIDPLTDFGFKKIFANPNHKDITIFLLNSLLDLEKPIREIEFQNLEDSADSLEVRGVIYDILCRDENNREFIVELQRAKQEFFGDRSLFYVCRHLNSQIKKSRLPENRRKRFELLPIYFLGILNFNTFEGEKYIRKGSVRDDDCNKLSDGINLTFVELPKFNVENPKTDREKILYFLKNSEDLNENSFNDPIFEEILDIANYYNLSDSEQLVVDTILNRRLAEIDAIETAKKDFLEQGIEEGKKRRNIEIAKNLLENGVDISIIKLSTGLEIEEIENLQKEKR